MQGVCGCKKHLTYRGIKIRIKSNFSSKTIQTRREWGGIFTVVKRKEKKTKILYSTKLSFKKVKEKYFLRHIKTELTKVDLPLS